jgi:NitT/TauT family transport system substrate-binding protein
MKPWKTWMVFGLGALLAFPAVAAAQLRTVKVANTSKPVMDNLYVFVGMHMKFFEEVGLKVEPSYFRGGGEVIRAITTRSVDLGVTAATTSSMIAIAKGEAMKIVATNVAPLVGLVWLVEVDSPIKSVKDLKGKKVGFSSPGSVTHQVIQKILKIEGLDKDTQIVRVGAPGDSWAAVKNKVVDAGWHVLPGYHTLLLKNEARVLIRAEDYVKQYSQTCVVAMDDVIQKDPDLIRNFLKARVKAVRFIKDKNNAERVIQIWAEELKLPVEAVRLAYKDMNPEWWEDTGRPKPENLRAAMEEVLSVGAIKEPLDLAKIQDLRFLPK